ncbi:MAG: cupin [Verrucomicrobiales bacterium]|nr:cupin [Verrucomicrobiales bacterium]
MKKEHLRFESEFRIVFGKGKCQFAEMTLQPGATEGGPDNRHKGADQWLFVISGRGVAVVSGTAHKLSKWTLLLIERGETHEIRNTGRTALRTLNAYAPLAYTKSGNALPAGKPF